MNIRQDKSSVGDPEAEKFNLNDIYGDNSFELIGDSIKVSNISNIQNLTAYRNRAFSPEIDVFEGKFRLPQHEKHFYTWTKHYPEEIKSFVRNNIEDESSRYSIENAKIGIVSYQKSGIDGHSALCVEPINHLVTVAFNRRLARERIRNGKSSDAHRLWESCLSDLLSTSSDIAKLNFPSQLFVEVALVTADDFVVISEKSSRTSVYSLRYGNKVKTCGLESGLNWTESVIESDAGFIKINLIAGIQSALKREFPMPEWESKFEHLEIDFRAFALQTLHLNSTVLGVCKIPFTKSQLSNELLGKTAGGLDHSNLDFLAKSECPKIVASYKENTGWHGSAMMRLSLI